MNIKSIFIGAACMTLSACYIEKPLDTIPPLPATRIAANLTDSGTVVMGNAIGPGVMRIEGIVESADRNAWMLHMLHADQKDGRVIDWNRELVTFPSNVLVNPTVRILDKKKSWLAAVGVTAGAIIIGRAFNVIGADSETDNTPPPAASVLVR